MFRSYRFKKFPAMTDENVSKLNYMNPDFLKMFLMESGRIIPTRVSKVPQKHQRKLTRAIKLARYLALLPYTD
ncbi:MAG: 30S ribosomal protein S18 [Gammaproteobacteria bacterium]|nr:30S ribosomal protein S18 [Gammaproteobacteria bacterium]